MNPRHWFSVQDVRHALRLLAKTPISSLLTVSVLAGGLSVAIFTFSFLYTAMLKPLPVERGEELVKILSVSNGRWGAIDAADLAAIRPGLTTLAALGAYTSREGIVGAGDGTRSIQVTETEWNVFEATHARPSLGRGFRPEDQEAGAEKCVVLSDATFRSVFGGDRRLIGSRVTLDGLPTRVLGVMPAGYGFPVASEAWAPIPPEVLAETTPDRRAVEVFARLAPGASARAAEAELTAKLLAVRSAQPVPAPPPSADDRESEAPVALRVETFPMAQIGEVGPVVLAALNAVAGLILLLACVNVTNLLVARANERARETAVRLALGAPRSRLVLQGLWEIALLCVAGGALATVLSGLALEALNGWARARLAGNLAFWWVWGFDRSVVVAAGAFVTLAIAALGSMVAFRANRTEVNALLRDGAAQSGDRREGRVARILVVGQVATVSVLMFVGCLSGVIAHRVIHVDLGYDTRNLLDSSVEPPVDRYPDPAARARFFETLYDRLAARPELEGVVFRAPLAEISSEEGALELEDPTLARPKAFVQAIQGSLAPLGLGLVEGRFFEGRDRENDARAALVSRSFAARYGPKGSLLGRRIRLSGLAEARWRTVVGVVDDVLLGNPLSRDRSAVAVYVPLAQTAAGFASVELRHRGDRQAAQTAFFRTLGALDPQVVPGTVQSFEEVLEKTSLLARSVAGLLGLCFGFALLLAASGTYGLMSRSIGRRGREIGVRRALGASERDVLRMLLCQGARQYGVGALIALPATLLAGFAFSRLFPVSFGLSLGVAFLVAAAVSAIVLAATWVPGRRALAIEVRDALWRE